MITMIKKEALLKELRADIDTGKEKLERIQPLLFPHDAVIYYIIKDEMEYIESLIEAIERGDYDGSN